MLKDIGTERAILAGLCQYGSEGYFEIADFIKIDIFYDTKNQLLFKTLEYLFSLDHSAIDQSVILSGINSLGYTAQLTGSSTDQEYIRSLFNFPIKLENLRNLAVKLVTLYIARQAQVKHKEAFDSLGIIKGHEDINDILSLCEKPYFDILKFLTTKEEDNKISNLVEDYVQKLEENPQPNVGIPTPFPIFNSVVGGGLRTGVHLIAGRLKSGKSSIGKEVCVHSSVNLEIPTLYIDTEMSTEEQMNRMLAGLSKVNVRNIESGLFVKNEQEKEAVNYAKEKLKKGLLWHYNMAGKPFKEILAVMNRWIHKNVGFTEDGKTKPHLIVYDYFKMMDTESLKDMPEYQAMGFQIAALHDFCQKYQTPVLSFVQINRDGITKESSDVIAQSDRLGWNAISLSLWKRKTPDEIAEDGIKNGNVKLIPLEGRFMSRLDDGDYINFMFQGEYANCRELKTRNMSKTNSGFEVKDSTGKQDNSEQD